MKNPVLVDLTKGQKHKLPTNIEHFYAKASKRSISATVKHFIDTNKSERCIVFTNRKIEASNITNSLKRMGLEVAELHSDVSQARREIILEKFRKGTIKVICATDVAARGIDIPEIDLILHVEPPQNGIDFYVHRSGRTGRAGRAGKSIVLDVGVNSELLQEMGRVVKFKRLEVPSEVLSSADPSGGGYRNRNSMDEDEEFGAEDRGGFRRPQGGFRPQFSGGNRPSFGNKPKFGSSAGRYNNNNEDDEDDFKPRGGSKFGSGFQDRKFGGSSRRYDD